MKKIKIGIIILIITLFPVSTFASVTYERTPTGTTAAGTINLSTIATDFDDYGGDPSITWYCFYVEMTASDYYGPAQEITNLTLTDEFEIPEGQQVTRIGLGGAAEEITDCNDMEFYEFYNFEYDADEPLFPIETPGYSSLTAGAASSLLVGSAVDFGETLLIIIGTVISIGVAVLIFIYGWRKIKKSHL